MRRLERRVSATPTRTHRPETFRWLSPLRLVKNPDVPLKDLFSRDNPIRLGLRRRRLGRHLIKWEIDGRPAPPPDLVKRGMIKAYARQFGCRYLVETGTFFGETVAATLNTFEKIWSIELESALAAAAQKRFAAHQHVQIIEGDSSNVLQQIMPQLDKSTLFWLDGHWNGDDLTARGETSCPLLAELEAILAAGPERHVVLIDDARSFTGRDEYPALSEIREFVRARWPKTQFYVLDDAIRIHRPEDMPPP